MISTSSTSSSRSSLLSLSLPNWQEGIPFSLLRKYSKEIVRIERSLNPEDATLYRPLWIEAYAFQNCVDIVSHLLDNFPNLPIGRALFFAADKNLPEIAYEILKRNRADTRTVSEAYDVAIDRRHLAVLAEIAIVKNLAASHCLQDLVNLAKEGHADFLIGFILLLQEEEFPLTIFDSLLQVATQFGRLAVIENLCVYVRLHWFERAKLIEIAARFGHLPIIQFFLSFGPIPEKNFTSAIQYASLHQSERLVSYLEEERKKILALEKHQKWQITEYFQVSLFSIRENSSLVLDKIKDIPIDVLKAVFRHVTISKDKILALAAEHNRVDIFQTFVEEPNEFFYNLQFAPSDSYLFSDSAFQEAFEISFRKGFSAISTILLKYRRPPLGGAFYKQSEEISPLTKEQLVHFTSSCARVTV